MSRGKKIFEWVFTIGLILAIIVFALYVYLLSHAPLVTAPQQRCTENEFIKSVYSNNLEAVKVAARSARNINHRSCRSEQAIEIAAKNGNYEIFMHLISIGAEIEPRRSKIFVSAHFGKNDKILQYLIENHTTTPFDMEIALRAAIKYKNITVVMKLLDKGADVHSNLTGGGSVLASASYNSDLDMMKLLISKGIDVNQRGLSEGFLPDGLYPPIVLVAKNGNIDALKLLVENKVNVNPEPIQYHSPLMWSVSRKKLDMTRYLVEHGADLSAKSRHGRTAIEIARNMRVELEPDTLKVFEELLVPPGEG